MSYAVVNKIAVNHSQQARDIEPLLVQCWSSVYDAGSTMAQYLVFTGLPYTNP